MIVLKGFIARENLAKYNAGDYFPRAGVSPARIAELVKKGYLKPEESEAPAADDKPEKEVEKVEKPKTKTSRKSTRAKKG